MYDVTMRNVPGQRLAAKARIGPYGAIAQSYEGLRAILIAHSLGADAGMIAIYHDDPSSLEASKLRRCDLWAGFRDA